MLKTLFLLMSQEQTYGCRVYMQGQKEANELKCQFLWAVPLGRGPQFSMIGAISVKKIEAAMYGEWATNGEIFYAFIDKVLLPQLKSRHIVIMDNVKFHLQARIREAIESKSAKVIFLPPYSPDLTPIENMWSKIKNTLRRLAPRTTRTFKKCIRMAFLEVTKTDLIGWFKHCGYVGGLS